MLDEASTTAPDGWYLTSAERGNEFSALDRRREDGAAWSAGNRVETLMHGATYFRRLLETICELGAGDRLYFNDWRGEPDQRLSLSTDLRPRRPFARHAPSTRVVGRHSATRCA
jgi:hypothetical protein